MTDKKHYYFKLGKANSIFEQLVNSDKYKIQKELPKEGFALAIYYESEKKDSWTAECLNDKKYDDDEKKKEYLKEKTSGKLSHVHILKFNNIEKGDLVWIFYKLRIYCFKCTDNKLFDAKKNGKYNYLFKKTKKPQQPKAKMFKLHNIWSAEDVPQFFATIGSNRSYNQHTIKELKEESAELNVAKKLYNKNSETICISLKKPVYNNLTKYLSPTQFETLIFLIYLYKGGVPDSYKGTSREIVDLTVYYDSPEKEFDVLNIQVKNKKSIADFEKTISEYNERYKKDGEKTRLALVHSGEIENSDSYIYGENWIIDNIKNFPDEIIAKWLKKQFSSEIFNSEELMKGIKAKKL